MHSAATAFEKQKATPVSQPLKDIEASQGSSSSVPGQQLSFQVEDASTHEASTSVPQQAWEWIQRLMQYAFLKAADFMSCLNRGMLAESGSHDGPCNCSLDLHSWQELYHEGCEISSQKCKRNEC